MRCLRYWVGAATAWALFALSLSTGHTTEYSFHLQDSSTKTRSLVATVRVFKSGKEGGDQVGSGFVIDSLDGLILTAGHVVRDLKQDPLVAFPGSTDRYPVKVVTATMKPDLAVLQFNPLVNDVDILEVQFDGINKEQVHELTGYARSNSEPEEEAGQPSPSDKCMYNMKAMTIHGDSGSAVLTSEGLVDGIALEGVESDGTYYSEMRVLSLSCVKDIIIKIVSDNQSIAIINSLFSGSEDVMRRAFQPPPPPRPRWVSNLRLAKAISSWIEKYKAQIPFNRPMDLPELMRIIVQRGLGYELASAFNQATARNDSDAADSLQQFADYESKKGTKADVKYAYTAYGEAKSLYINYLRGSDPGQRDRSQLAAANWSAAVNMIKLARISGKQEDTDKAGSFASAAILLAPSGPLKAASWASLAGAAHMAGNPGVAVPAYKAALAEGATAAWVSQGLVAAKEDLGGGAEIDLSAGYLTTRARTIEQGS